MNSIEKKLRDLENEEKKLAEKKQQLLEEQKLLEVKQQKLEELFNSSGYSSPKELVEDLIEKYRIRLNTASSSSTTTGKRKRTRITGELRDEVKQELASGKTKMAVSKDRDISYVVIGKIAKGEYDHL